jgi:hypothetical protein
MKELDILHLERLRQYSCMMHDDMIRNLGLIRPDCLRKCSTRMFDYSSGTRPQLQEGPGLLSSKWLRDPRQRQPLRKNSIGPEVGRRSRDFPG